MPSCVIDTSAVFIDLQNERGASEARKWLRNAAVSSVNLHEIAAKMVEKGASRDQARTVIEKLRLTVHPLSAEEAIEGGFLRIATKAQGLGLGDRACLALAKRLDLPAVTGDRAWAEMADELGIEVVVVR